MNQILLCSATLLVLFTVANCQALKPANSSISDVPKSDSENSRSPPKISPKNDEVESNNAKDDSVQTDSKKNSIKSDAEEEDDLALSDAQTLKADFPPNNNTKESPPIEPENAVLPKRRNSRVQNTIRALQQRLFLERNTTFMFRNISVALMREVEVKKQEILNARKSNLNLEVELNDANRRILELNLQLEDARKSVRPCPKKDPTNQLKEAKLIKKYREEYWSLVKELIKRLFKELPKPKIVPYSL
ncbi:accessory gland-specific peptide 26Aa [Drosophila yakuba]|uniref:Acp26Aa n=1 Tax=Drosophila yakuba TaxID=7245 RepID=B4NZU6_DROYA|nr:accessory gland-specific peptide 26Aa [Drosophila yakuba]EDW88880.1 Acp26Aa [Drosophila yakuba]